jgi:hypothetical protein
MAELINELNAGVRHTVGGKVMERYQIGRGKQKTRDKLIGSSGWQAKGICHNGFFCEASQKLMSICGKHKVCGLGCTLVTGGR